MKKLLDSRYRDNPFTIVLKVIQTLVFAWSCFFWGGVTILNFYINDTENSHLADGFLIGTMLIAVSVILCYMRAYLVQLPFCAVGIVVYLVNAGEMIDVADVTQVVFTPSFELRYMPSVAVIIISCALCMLQIWSLIAKREAKKNEFNNSPTKSIFDE